MLVVKVIGFVEAPLLGLDLPLDVRGTAFQQRVAGIAGDPHGFPGELCGYREADWAPKSVSRVARVCAANTIAVAIPCHHVVRKDGALSGYRWGTARKRPLLERETAT